MVHNLLWLKEKIKKLKNKVNEKTNILKSKY